MIDLEKLTDEEVWILTCGVERLHDDIRKDSCYTEGIVEKAEDIRERLTKEYNLRKISYSRWEK